MPILRKDVFQPKITERKLICSCDLDGDSCTLLVQVRPEPSGSSAKHSRDSSFNGDTKKLIYIDQRNILLCINECNCKNSVGYYVSQILHIFPLHCFTLIGSFVPSCNGNTIYFICQFVCVALTFDSRTIFPTFAHQFHFTC